MKPQPRSLVCVSGIGSFSLSPLGNFLLGLAGAIYAQMTGFIAPANFQLGDSLAIVSILILGGIGNIWGILPATLLVVLLPEKLQIVQEYRFLIFALVVMVVLIVRPSGLLPRRLRRLRKVPHHERYHTCNTWLDRSFWRLVGAERTRRLHLKGGM
ncbi:ABC transporter permease subunit [Rhizobium beringeri]